MRTAVNELGLEKRLKERLRPAGSPVMFQQWSDLLFLHWSLDPNVLQHDLPEGLRVDTFDGRAWVGVVPFQMKGVRPRFLPAVPGLSDFPELNLRTYVVDPDGRPGVWFYSLDTSQRMANWIARSFFHLNYRFARFAVSGEGGLCDYRSELKTGAGGKALQRYKWQRVGEVFTAEAGSLDFFLAERYRLYAYNRNKRRLITGRVHHQPYPLQRVRLDDYSKYLFKSAGLPTPDGGPASAIASPGVDVEIFGLETVDA
ncbi:MAG: YqjF family protein [Opitutales bacterium]